MELFGSQPLTKEEEERIDAWFGERLPRIAQNLQSFSVYVDPRHNKERVLNRHQLLIIRNHCYWMLGMTTGFRSAELLSIRLRQVWDFEMDRPRAILEVDKQYMKGKKRARRAILVAKAKEAIQNLIVAW